MRSTILLFFLLIALSPLAARAWSGPVDPSIKKENVDSDCFDPALSPEKTENSFKISNGPNVYKHCDVTNLAYRVRKALFLLKQLPTLDDENTWDQVRIGNPWEFFVKRVRQIDLQTNSDDTCSTSMDSGVDAYASDILHHIVICKAAVVSSDLDLAQILLHEARHAGGDKISRNGGVPLASYFPHVACEFASSKGELACDRTIHDNGSYAISFNSFLGLSRAVTLSPALRAWGRSHAITELNGRFVLPPDGTGKVLVLVRDSNQVDAYDGEKSTMLFQAQEPDSFVAGGLGSLRIFEHKNGLATEFENTPNLSAKPTNSYFFDHLVSGNSQPIVDAALYNDVNCLLFPHGVRCWNNDDIGKPIDLALPAGTQAIQFFFKDNNVDLPHDKSGESKVWVVVGESGVPLAREHTAFLLPSKWKDWRRTSTLKVSDKSDAMVRTFIDVAGAPWHTPDALKKSVFQLERASCQVTVRSAQGPSQLAPGANLPAGCTIRMISDFYWGDTLENL